MPSSVIVLPPSGGIVPSPLRSGGIGVRVGVGVGVAVGVSVVVGVGVSVCVGVAVGDGVPFGVGVAVVAGVVVGVGVGVVVGVDVTCTEPSTQVAGISTPTLSLISPSMPMGLVLQGSPMTWNSKSIR